LRQKETVTNKIQQSLSSVQSQQVLTNSPTLCDKHKFRFFQIICLWT